MKLATALTAALLVSATLVAPAVRPADAHSELRSSQPSAGQPVGGDVEVIFLEFVSPIGEFSGTLEDPDGNVVGGRVGRPDDFSVIYELDRPLSIEGQHVLRYSTIAEDGFVQESALAFTYDQSAPEFVLTLPDGPGDEDSGPDWAMIAGVGLIIVGLAMAVAHRLRRSSGDESN